jgi:hypothetical protein
MASLRDEMPDTAEAIDQLREVFGAELIDSQIRKAMKGGATFYAEENGRTFGVKPLPNVKWLDCPVIVMNRENIAKDGYAKRK